MIAARIFLLGITVALYSGCANTIDTLAGNVVFMKLDGTGSLQFASAADALILEKEHVEYHREFRAQHDALGEKDWPTTKIEDAQCQLAERYLKGTPTPNRPRAESIVPLMKLARDQDCRPTEERIAKAKAKKGIGFAEGVEAYNKGDYAAAMEHWLPIAEYGHAGAQYNVGFLFEFKKADRYLKQCSGYSINRQSCFAPLNPGDNDEYFHGDLRRRTAMEWYTKSAEQGFADAQWALGAMLIGRDGTKGMELLLKAAEQGHANAQNALAVRYHYGKDGAPQDRDKAEMWYRRAAKRGSIDAPKNLAILAKENKEQQQKIAWDRERQRKIAKICPKGIGNLGELIFANPYDVKGKCYGFAGRTLQILSRSTGFYQLNRSDRVYIDFGRNAAPAQIFQGYVKGVGVFSYTTVMGAKMIVPSLVAANLPPEELPANAAD